MTWEEWQAARAGDAALHVAGLISLEELRERYRAALTQQRTEAINHWLSIGRNDLAAAQAKRLTDDARVWAEQQERV